MQFISQKTRCSEPKILYPELECLAWLATTTLKSMWNVNWFSLSDHQVLCVTCKEYMLFHKLLRV